MTEEILKRKLRKKGKIQFYFSFHSFFFLIFLRFFEKKTDDCGVWFRFRPSCNEPIRFRCHSTIKKKQTQDFWRLSFNEQKRRKKKVNFHKREKEEKQKKWRKTKEMKKQKKWRIQKQWRKSRWLDRPKQQKLPKNISSSKTLSVGVKYCKISHAVTR